MKRANEQDAFRKRPMGKSGLPNKPTQLKKRINRFKNHLNKEKVKMKNDATSNHKARTRQFIQAGGLFQKSGLLEAFNINPGDDLQDYSSQEKAAALLGFLIECFEKNEFDEGNFERWKKVGNRLLR